MSAAATVKSPSLNSSFVITSFNITREGFLNWTSIGEEGALPYKIEQYIFDRWVTIGEIEGIGTQNANSYSYYVLLHSGTNRFRLKQQNADKTYRYSTEISIVSYKQEAQLKYKSFQRTVKFSRDTFYQMYDPYGSLVSSGVAGAINLRKFPKGRYCVIYDNKMYTVSK